MNNKQKSSQKSAFSSIQANKREQQGDRLKSKVSDIGGKRTKLIA